MPLTPEILAFAHRHHGLVSLGAWTALGRSRASYYRAIDSGLLVRVVRDVVALAGIDIGPIQRIHAGVLALGPGSCASHRSAAFLWGVDIVGDRPVELLQARAARSRLGPGLVVHRPRDGARVRAVLRSGVPTTPPIRTLLDLGASAPDAVAGALESLVRAGHATLPAVGSALQRRRRQGTNGVRPLADALEAVMADGVVTDSQLEKVMRRLLRRGHLVDWTFHPVIEGYEVDFAFLEAKLVIEVDGWSVHGASRRNWHRDRERDLILAATGWLVLRLSWTMVNRQQDKAIARIRSTLVHRGFAVGSSHR